MHRLAIHEGWSTVLLTSALVFVSVRSILRADWADGLGILNLITLAGLVAGLVVAKQRRLPSPVAHGLAMLAGVIVILFQTTQYLDDRLGTRWDKLSWLWDRGEGWAAQIARGERADDLYLFVLFISLLTFVLAYSSMWFVIRVRWIWAALVLPALLLFINLGYSLRVPTSYVAIYLFFALILLMRFSLLQRETVWQRTRVAYPSSLVWRGMWAATYLAVAIIIFGWAFPASARSAQAHDVWLKVDGPWRSVEAQFNEWFASLRGPARGGIGGFASFSDSFDIGGPLRLSNTPVVLVTGSGSAPYLAAHRYSIYTGRGWESEPTTGDGEDGTTAPSQVELAPDEPTPVDPSVAQTREQADYVLTVQRPRGNIVFAPETFLSADIGVHLTVPWTMVTNQRVDLMAGEPEAPAELRDLVALLQDADFSPPPAPESTAAPGTSTSRIPAAPTPTPPAEPAPEPDDVRAERRSLAERGITTDYVINPETWKAETLIYSGQFPRYDDVEAIHARDGLAPGDTYAITALETTAFSADLRDAGTNLPEPVVDRYLQLPETVTPRTMELARQIASAAATPFDQAEALETWLRANITYQEDVDFPPEDQDVVDYVLFDSKVGYCEYYASAFTIMARSIGLPTRMVTGFFPADRDAEARGFLYRERNAHAWPEVYFPGYGWIAFEPTANRSDIAREPVPDTSPSASTDPVGTGAGDILPDDEAFLGERGGGFSGSVDGAGTDQSDAVTQAEWAIRIVFLLLMALTVVVAWLWLRGMRGLSLPAQLYTKASRAASWGGIRREASMTPHEYARIVGRAVPGSRVPATFLTDLYVRETYGQQRLSQTELQRARHAWTRLRGLLLKHLVLRLRPWRVEAAEDDGETW